MPKTKYLIEQLSKRYALYYLSDNVKERVDALDSKFHFLSLFKGGIFSHEVGVRKPNPKIYQFALNKCHARPDETVFIDDKQLMLDPARILGIETILFTSSDALETVLQDKRFI